MIDLSSDTVTVPTAGMRKAMYEAEVGDEQKGTAPTVNKLLEKVEALLGKEAAIFVPSGTMSNLIAVNVHVRPGEEIILAKNAHMLIAEKGGHAAYSGAIASPQEGPRGIFSVGQVEEAIRPVGRYFPQTAMVSIEHPTNLGGGACWSIQEIEAICELARRHRLKTHLVGARLMNAVIKTGIAAHTFAAPFDSVWIAFSKGLGAPFGAVLAGSQEFIQAAWDRKQQLGGAMRQVGPFAAACIYALENHVKRLAEDHANAQLLADGLAELPGILILPEECETNIVLFELHPDVGLTAGEFVDRMEEGYSVRFFTPDRASRVIRAMTHLDVSCAEIEATIQAAKHFVQTLPSRPRAIA